MLARANLAQKEISLEPPHLTKNNIFLPINSTLKLCSSAAAGVLGDLFVCWLGFFTPTVRKKTKQNLLQNIFFFMFLPPLQPLVPLIHPGLLLHPAAGSCPESPITSLPHLRRLSEDLSTPNPPGTSVICIETW